MNQLLRRLTLLLLALIWQSALWAADMPITTQDKVAYLASDPKTLGYLARPAASGNYPGIILIHEWWGLNDNIKENARRFAAMGYVALAVDLYHGQATKSADEARQMATAVRGDMKTAFANLEAAMNYVKAQPGVRPDSLASIGWCFGGGWSYQMAKNNLGVKATVIYYGFFNPADDLSKMRAEILGNFAEKDRAIKVDDVKEFQVKLKGLKGEHEVYIYGDADHAFANPESERYNKEAAELAWQRTMNFLEKRMK